LGYCVQDDATTAIDVLDDGYALSLAPGGVSRHGTLAEVASALRMAAEARGQA